jgi:FkbM family methyltransferase
MTFISYAQNFEDVMLWRALKHIEQGFYIDIGAAWPDEHSVTKAFYDQGWKGINVEPNPELHCQLQETRVRDLNLRLAIGDHDGIMLINFLPGTGLSTLSDAIAEQHQKSGWHSERHEVQVTTIKSLWHQHLSSDQDVHFLKVDVEGLEEIVLRGNDWDKNRPWVVIVESTLPMSQAESYESWESILIDNKYLFAYADGLNRFYIAAEHPTLLSSFKYPPNVFDDFVLETIHKAEQRAQQADNYAKQTEERAQQADNYAKQTEERAQQADNYAKQAEERAQQSEQRQQQLASELEAVYRSTSWRLTKPLRLLLSLIRKVKTTLQQNKVFLITALKAITKRQLNTVLRWLLARPRLRSFLIRKIARYPVLYTRLRTLAFRLQRNKSAEQTSINNLAHANQSSLSKPARKVWADIQRKQEENDAYRT